jgi:hypothetical protein
VQDLIIDIVGWVGGAAVVVAYLLISANKIQSNSINYQMLNLVGSIFLIINTFAKGAYPSTVVNIIWVAIAIYALRNTLRIKLRTSK